MNENNTPEQELTYAQLYQAVNAIHERVYIVESIAKEVLGNPHGTGYVHEIEETCVTLRYTYYGRCGSEDEDYTIPMEWLNTDNREKIRELLEAEKALRIQKAAEEVEKEKLRVAEETLRKEEEIRAKDLAELARLRDKYGN